MPRGLLRGSSKSCSGTAQRAALRAQLQVEEQGPSRCVGNHGEQAAEGVQSRADHCRRIASSIILASALLDRARGDCFGCLGCLMLRLQAAISGCIKRRCWREGNRAGSTTDPCATPLWDCLVVKSRFPAAPLNPYSTLGSSAQILNAHIVGE